MTLKEIAKKAEVSVSTVSRVLNDKQSKAASEETKERIWKIIREHGYTPNDAARQLRKASKEVHHAQEPTYFACVYARSQDNKDRFFAELTQAIEHEAYKHNCLLRYSIYAQELSASSLTAVTSFNDISGIIVLGRFADPALQAVIEAQKNVVYVGLNGVSSRHDTVFCDGFKAGKLAMETLLSYGHRNIVYMGKTKQESRYDSYVSVLKSNGLAVERSRIMEVAQTLDGGHTGVKTLLEKGRDFSAIFCANDATAMGAIRALREEKIRIPEEVSVIGIDDIEMARYFHPMLTTIHIPIGELGAQTAKMLVDKIQHGHGLPMKIELPFSLIERESCGQFKR